MAKSYLLILSSSCQMYSGTGTALFDWLRFARDDFSFSVLMDCEYRDNAGIVAAFCRKQGIALYLMSPSPAPGCPDAGVSGIALHLAEHQYDVIECISWANAATNMAVLECVPTTTKLVFTPHSQPSWTIGGEERYFMVPGVFARMVNAADAVFVLSQSEKQLPAFAGADESAIHCAPHGIDANRFAPSGGNRPDLLTCVCDCNEPRKRIDLLLAAIESAVKLRPGLKMVLAGKGSDAVSVPESLEDSISRLGYVSEERLTRLYQESGLMVLLSDYEAFGLPIAEALCCGSRVLLNSHEVMRELFEGLPGVHWTKNTDVHATARKIVEIADTPEDPIDIAAAAAARYSWEANYGRKRDVILNLLASGQTSRSRPRLASFWREGVR